MCNEVFSANVMETQQDTNAPSKYLRDNLREMDQYIVKIDSDIIKFNDYVDEQIEGLTARGETKDGRNTSQTESRYAFRLLLPIGVEACNNREKIRKATISCIRPGTHTTHDSLQ